MSLNDLLKNMGRLEAELQRFEAKFGVKSKDFYGAMLRGELEEFDGSMSIAWSSWNGWRFTRRGPASTRSIAS